MAKPRATWSGQIRIPLKGSGAFALTIPVRLYTAQEDRGVRFNQVHSCGSRITRPYHCDNCGMDVSYSDIQKGYPAGEEFIIVDDEELEEIRGDESSKAIVAEAFFPVEEVDPVYFDASYHVGPDDGGEQLLAIFYNAMKRRRDAILGRLSLRKGSRARPCLIRASGNGLTLHQMHWPDEIRDGIDLAEIQVSRKDIAQADEMVTLKATHFDPSSIKDEFREKVEALLARKVSGAPPSKGRKKQPSSASDLLSGALDIMKEG